MTLAGWLFMIGSWSFIIGLSVFCIYRILTAPEEDL